jgi:hypothetical protein
MSSEDLIEEFIRRGGVIEQCAPEPDPPVFIRPHYRNAQKKHFVEGDKSRRQQTSQKGAIRYGRFK